jgi:hypothetical protein
MAKRKVTAEKLFARDESNGYKGGAIERKAALATRIDTKIRSRRIKMPR